jgi:hypothetical protein
MNAKARHVKGFPDKQARVWVSLRRRRKRNDTISGPWHPDLSLFSISATKPTVPQ